MGIFHNLACDLFDTELSFNLCEPTFKIRGPKWRDLDLIVTVFVTTVAFEVVFKVVGT